MASAPLYPIQFIETINAGNGLHRFANASQASLYQPVAQAPSVNADSYRLQNPKIISVISRLEVFSQCQAEARPQSSGPTPIAEPISGIKRSSLSPWPRGHNRVTKLLGHELGASSPARIFLGSSTPLRTVLRIRGFRNASPHN